MTTLPAPTSAQPPMRTPVTTTARAPTYAPSGFAPVYAGDLPLTFIPTATRFGRAARSHLSRSIASGAGYSLHAWPPHRIIRLAVDDRLDRLRWLLALAPACAVLIVEVVQHQVLGREPAVGPAETAVTCGLLLVISFPVARLAFGALDRARAAAAARARELEAMDLLVRERERLSRELHDGTAQLLTYLLLRTQTVEQLVAADRKDDALLELEGMRAAADALYIDVRESISGLRTRVLDRGLAEALRDCATDFAESHELQVTLDINEAECIPHLSRFTCFELLRRHSAMCANTRKRTTCRSNCGA